MAAAKKITCLSCAQVNRVPTEKITASPKCGTCGQRLFSSKVPEVDLATLQKAARNDDVPLVVDFWAPWCGPCKVMGPEFQRSAAQMSPDARLVKLNTEANPKASQRYGIRGIPTMALFQNGKEKARQSGAQKSPAISAWVKQHSR
ncbi:MAG: thioredoxin TrxC [Pseudoruegeria sp.]